MTNVKENTKYFVSSDIHGFYTYWMEGLKEAGFDIGNPKHKIIVCGDLLDRGNEAVKCLEFVSKMIDQNRIILIKGNHEWLFDDIYKKQYFESYDYHNKTIETYEQLAGMVSDGYADIKNLAIIDKGFHHPLMQKYREHLINYYETEKYIFCHGYLPVEYDKYSIPHLLKDWRNASPQDWSNASWLNGYWCWGLGEANCGKTVVIGHFSTAYAHALFHEKGISYKDYWDNNPNKIQPCNDIFKEDGIIGLDTTTVVSHKVNVLVLQKGMKVTK